MILAIMIIKLMNKTLMLVVLEVISVAFTGSKSGQLFFQDFWAQALA